MKKANIVEMQEKTIAYSAPTLKVYGAMQRLTASGSKNDTESSSLWCVYVNPNGDYCMGRMS